MRDLKGHNAVSIANTGEYYNGYIKGDKGESWATAKSTPISRIKRASGISHQSLRCHKNVNTSATMAERPLSFLMMFILLLPEAIVADVKHVKATLAECTQSVPWACDDRLSAHIKTGVHQDRNPRRLTETL